MRNRIIIDTANANGPDAVETDMPFTLSAYKDADDGTQGQTSLQIGGERCLVGGEIPEMLHELVGYWSASAVLDPNDNPLPDTSATWREYVAIEQNPCDECDERPATQFWPKLATPVQLCDPCTHNARRSGWEPGR